MKIDAYFEPLVVGREFSGVVAVAKGEDILSLRTYGMADFEAGIEHKPDDEFAIASLSKTFTAAAITSLADEGRLSLDDTLSTYIPDFPKGNKITIRMLLLHQSGVQEEHRFEDFLERRNDAITLEEQVSRIAGSAFQFEPGTDSSYSNSGYILLARVIEIVSEMPFEQSVLDLIGVHLELKKTRFNSDPDNKMKSYWPGRSLLSLERAPSDGHYSHNLGASSMRSTVIDLLKWLRASNIGGGFDVTRFDYPYGWGRREYFGRRAIEQSGISSGFISIMIMFPDDDIYVAILSNIRAGRPQQRAHIDVSGLVFGEVAPSLREYENVTPNPNTLQQFAGHYAFPGVGTIIVREAGEALSFEWEGFDIQSYLYPVGESRFWNKLDGSEISFRTDGARPASALIWAPGDEEIVAPRIP